MLNGNGKSKVQRKSLSLKKCKVKESTTGKQADISSFFQKKANVKILEKTSIDEGNSPVELPSDLLLQNTCNGGETRNHPSGGDLCDQPKTKKNKNENISLKSQNASSAEDKYDAIAMETGRETSKVHAQSSFECDEELLALSDRADLSACYTKTTTLMNGFVSEKPCISSKLHLPRNRLSSGLLTKNDSQGSQSPVPGKIDTRTPSPGTCLPTADDHVIPPTPPLVPGFREHVHSTCSKPASGYFLGGNNRRQASLSLKNKSKNNLTNRGKIIGNKPTTKKRTNNENGSISKKGNGGISLDKKEKSSRFEKDAHDDRIVLDKNLLENPSEIETESSKENENSENAGANSAGRSSMQSTRKTFKLSRKLKKAPAEAGRKLLSRSSRDGKSSVPSSREPIAPRESIAPVFKKRDVSTSETQKDLDVLSGYGADISLLNDIDMGASKESRFFRGGAGVDTYEGNVPTLAGLNGRALKRFAEKGISPRQKRFSPMASESMIKPRRNLFEKLGQDENSNLDISAPTTQPMSDDPPHLGTNILPSSLDTVSKTRSENLATLGQCEDFFDISINSLNDEEMRELMDGVPWSPLAKGTTPQPQLLVSPAKLYVRSVSSELTSMTSHLTVDENTKNTCKETDKQGYQRYLVLEVYRREIMDEITSNTGSSSEKVLRLFDESNNTEKYCQLRDEWERTEVEHGDIVNIIACKPSITGSYILDNQKENYIVVHPDVLVTPTAISSSTKCLRRSILEKHFRTEGQKEVMFLGTLLHTIFDSALMSKDFSTKFVLDQTKQQLGKLSTMTELYGLGITEDHILSKVEEQAAALAEWAQKFVRDEPHPIHGIINFKDGATQKSNASDNVSVCVSKVVDIEECVWSPKFGLKGQVDATVEVKINKTPNILKKTYTGSYEEYVLPLELKTGKLYSKLGSVEHRAQVILYTLLMMDRYPQTMDTGLLVYLKTGHMLGVPAYLHEKRALVIKRNEMIRFLARSGTRLLQNMPGMLQDERSCNYCPQLQVCTLYHKSVEKGNSKSAGVGKLFDKMTCHLSAVHLEYFKHWNKLIALESQAMKESNREPDIWGLGGSEREQLGYCFSKMLLASCEPSDTTDRFVNTFVKQDPRSACVSIADMHLTKGDYVVVSLEDGIVALATGFLSDVYDKYVSILLDKDLTKCYHHMNSDNQGLYRIDKAEISTGAVMQWSNLAKLFFADSDQDAKLRRLIVNLEPPTFTRQKELLSSVTSSQVCEVWSSQLSACSMTSPIKSSQCDDELSNILNDLNVDQRKAVTKVLSAQDYALVLGMPGTGKTTTIAFLVRTLVSLGKSVLLTSYTHSAVDNILLKLKQSDVDFLRLGSVHKIHPDIQTYSVNNAAKNVHTVKELKEFYESKIVVATTCLGVNHTLFNQRSFDYCIVDEASQITQPVCFGSLRHASIFVLVGDHYQLPPLVQSHEAKEGGMDISLFKRLSENHPHAVVNLEHQYRMHKDIMLLSNTLIYQYRLKCGTEEVAEHLLHLPNWDSLREVVSEMDKQQEVPCTWLLDVLDPHSPVIFLDTDDLPAPETRSGRNVYNEKEAAVVASIAHALVQSGLDADSIGVISPYRHQLKVIKQHVDMESGNNANSLSDVEISTVDKYQGRDKLCVVVSLVRCNAGGHVGDLLRDWRRVNVALTRAKQKLILLGSRKTLKNNVLFRELLTLLEERCWVYNLPSEAWRVKLPC